MMLMKKRVLTNVTFANHTQNTNALSRDMRLCGITYRQRLNVLATYIANRTRPKEL